MFSSFRFKKYSVFLRIGQDFAKLEDNTGWNECNWISSPTSWSKQHQLFAETKSLPSQILITSKNRDLTTFLYSLFQCFAFFMVSRLFFPSNSPILSFQLLPLPLIIPPCSTLGTRLPLLRSFLQEDCPWPPPGIVFCRLNKPGVSALVFDHLHKPCTIPCLSVALPRDQAWWSRTEGPL